jgi:hypothetical protein
VQANGTDALLLLMEWLLLQARGCKRAPTFFVATGAGATFFLGACEQQQSTTQRGSSGPPSMSTAGLSTAVVRLTMVTLLCGTC